MPTLSVTFHVRLPTKAMPVFLPTPGPKRWKLWPELWSTITLKRANGTTVNHASPGARKFVISDQSSGHNFHLLGPGVSKKTAIDFIGSRTWKVTLRVGTYKFRCDVHPKMMRGSFMVS